MRTSILVAGATVLGLALAAAAPALAQQDDPAFATCSTCHSLTKGKNGIGPSLYGIVGAKKASVAGYAYSAALKAKGGTWTAAALDTYIAEPAKDAPGTKMPLGQKDPVKRAAVIALLKTMR